MLTTEQVSSPPPKRLGITWELERHWITDWLWNSAG